MKRIFKSKKPIILIIDSEAFNQDVVSIHNTDTNIIIQGTGFLRNLSLTQLKTVMDLCQEQLLNPELSDLSILDKEKLEQTSNQAKYNINRLLK